LKISLSSPLAQGTARPPPTKPTDQPTD